MLNFGFKNSQMAAEIAAICFLLKAGLISRSIYDILYEKDNQVGKSKTPTFILELALETSELVSS